MTFVAGGPRSMSREDYAAIHAIHFSVLKEMRKSAKHYQYREQHAAKETPAMRLGRAAHTGILEPMQFLREYAHYDGERRAGKAWEAFEAQHPSKTILKAAEYDLIVGMAEAVHAHPKASKYLAAGRGEQVVTWTDPATGIALKARLDWLCDVDGLAAFIDLKTTSSVDARLFGSTAARMGYNTQLAFYRQGLVANGIPIAAKLIAVEIDPPHDVGVFDVDGDVLHAGDEEIRELLQRLAECRASGKWPGRYPSEQPLRLPTWFYAADEGTPLGVTIDGIEA